MRKAGRLQDLLPGEERGQLGADDLLQQHVGVAVAAQRAHQPAQAGRDLHHGQPRLLLPFRRREQDGQVQAQVRELREGRETSMASGVRAGSTSAVK